MEERIDDDGVAHVIVTTKEFAEMINAHEGTISNALNRSYGKLLPAKMGRGRIDLNHPAVANYIKYLDGLKEKYKAGHKKRGKSKAYYRKKKLELEDRCRISGIELPPKLEPREVKVVLKTLPDDIRALVDWKLIDLIEHFGTSAYLREFVRAVKEIESVHEKRIKNAKDEGTVVSRDLIRRGVIEPFDLCFKRLLGDGARTIATRVAAMVNAGESIEACERFVSGKLSDFIKNAKTMAEGVINDAAT